MKNIKTFEEINENFLDDIKNFFSDKSEPIKNTQPDSFSDSTDKNKVANLVARNIITNDSNLTVFKEYIKRAYKIILDGELKNNDTTANNIKNRMFGNIQDLSFLYLIVSIIDKGGLSKISKEEMQKGLESAGVPKNFPMSDIKRMSDLNSQV